VKEEGGSLVFIAGPSPALSSSPVPSLYPGLQDNQAFLATKDLRTLAQQVIRGTCKLFLYLVEFFMCKPFTMMGTIITKQAYLYRYCLKRT
jgi:hypothetical protein